MLIEASRKDRTDICKMLVTHKDIDLDATNNDGKRAIDCTSKVAIKKILVGHGAEGPKKYLPKWSIFTAKYFPAHFKDVAFQWLLVAKRLKLSKDMRNLILQKIIENEKGC